MKKPAFCLFLFVFNVFCAFGQKYTLDNVLDFTTRSSGVIYKGKELTGYYVLTEIDKNSRNSRDYRLSILDQNLREIAMKEFAGNKDMEVVEVAYNGENLMVKLDNKKIVPQYMLFDKNANDITPDYFNPTFELGGLAGLLLNNMPTLVLPGRLGGYRRLRICRLYQISFGRLWHL